MNRTFEEQDAEQKHTCLCNLESMGFDPNYVNRAFKVYEKNYGVETYNHEVIIEIIIRLQHKDKEKLKTEKEMLQEIIDFNFRHNRRFGPRFIANLDGIIIDLNNQYPPSYNHDGPFPSYLTPEEFFRLRIGDKIDHRDEVGQFLLATVKDKQGTNIKIHYDGWSSKYDTWTDFENGILRFATAGAISQRPAHRLQYVKKGEHVDINPQLRHGGWKIGKIHRVDSQGHGQVQVCYEYLDKNCLYWTHLDNEDEIAEYKTKCGPSMSNAGEFKQKEEFDIPGARNDTNEGIQTEGIVSNDRNESWHRAKQFETFLKRNHLESYLGKFEEQCCNNLEFIDMFTDEFLQNDIKIKNKILRTRLLNRCVEVKVDMDRLKYEYGVSSLLHDRLSKYGLVTINILCDEIKKQSDLKNKYQIDNQNQSNFVWRLIQKHENQS